jgi:hypothetical protein
MAIYPIINKETGETKVIEMSVHDIASWYAKNPKWTRNWAEGSAGFVETGEWKDKLIKKNPGWNEVLQKVNKSAGTKSQIGKI